MCDIQNLTDIRKKFDEIAISWTIENNPFVDYLYIPHMCSVMFFKIMECVDE